MEEAIILMKTSAQEEIEKPKGLLATLFFLPFTRSFIFIGKKKSLPVTVLKRHFHVFFFILPLKRLDAVS